MADKCYLTSERNKKLLEELPNPKRLWHWFLWATEIPRGSGHTEKVSFIFNSPITTTTTTISTIIITTITTPTIINNNCINYG